VGINSKFITSTLFLLHTTTYANKHGQYTDWREISKAKLSMGCDSRPTSNGGRREISCQVFGWECPVGIEKVWVGDELDRKLLL